MIKKTLADFNYDYQAYTNYLETIECVKNKEHILIDNRGYDNKYSETKEATNPWLKYAEKLNLTPAEIDFFNELFNYKIQHQMEIEFLKLMYEYRQNERNGKCKEYKPSPKREY